VLHRDVQQTEARPSCRTGSDESASNRLLVVLKVNVSYVNFNPYLLHNTMATIAPSTIASVAGGTGGMDELLPLVKQLTDPEQVRSCRPKGILIIVITVFMKKLTILF
jgi:hypothetical protein